MKKYLVMLIMSISIMIAVTGCGEEKKENESTYESKGNIEEDKSTCEGYFNVIKEWDGADYCHYYIVYAVDTKVKYFMYNGRYEFTITPLFNADGTLQIYEEE